jgi:large subunit ribosomal protein L19
MANYLTYKDKRIAVGDRIIVKQIVKEDEKSRIQMFDGLLMSVRGQGINQSFVVRKIAAGNIGVERIFPLNSPNISDIEVKTKGNVRRANLSYLKSRVGRSALRVKEQVNNTQKTK